MHISIVALGPSHRQYIELVERLGGRHNYCGQTWVVNIFGDVLACVEIGIEDGRAQIVFTEKEPPTAEEIEARYDHSQHPAGGLLN